MKSLDLLCTQHGIFVTLKLKRVFTSEIVVLADKVMLYFYALANELNGLKNVMS